jgi:hypothetical protein
MISLFKNYMPTMLFLTHSVKVKDLLVKKYSKNLIIKKIRIQQNQEILKKSKKKIDKIKKFQKSNLNYIKIKNKSKKSKENFKKKFKKPKKIY